MKCNFSRMKRGIDPNQPFDQIIPFGECWFYSQFATILYALWAISGFETGFSSWF
ncbi:MAG: hypothetical protein GH151_04970 [Bacteroidetes bacterium]|nr:hypothetical protein [Bacteroidota bacterium]